MRFFQKKRKHENWVRDMEKRYGVAVVTPQEKIDSYKAALKFMKGEGMEFMKASQWVAIGDQYVRMGDLFYAKKSYLASLEYVNKVDISKMEFICEREKQEFENAVQILKDELAEKLADLSEKT